VSGQVVELPNGVLPARRQRVRRLDSLGSQGRP